MILIAIRFLLSGPLLPLRFTLRDAVKKTRSKKQKAGKPTDTGLVIHDAIGKALQEEAREESRQETEALRDLVMNPGPPIGGITRTKHPGGRPSKYSPKFVEQARFLCAQFPVTDEQLAVLFDVNVDTIYEWKKVHPEFSEALKSGKDEKDAQVERSLFERACGYTHKSEKIFMTKFGEIVRAETLEHYPPDPTSMIFWLKNRQKERWREQVDHSVTHTLENVSSEKLIEELAKLGVKVAA